MKMLPPIISDENSNATAFTYMLFNQAFSKFN